MAIYVVMEPPGGESAREKTVFVRDGFSWLGFLVPPLWLLWHRLWMEAALTVLVLVLVSALGEVLDAEISASFLTLLASFYVGLEGNGLRQAAFRRLGWREWGVIEADGVDDADIRYAMDGELPEEPDGLAAPRIVPDARQARPSQTGMALGIAHVPGKA